LTKTTVKLLGKGFEDGPSGCSVVLGYRETFKVALDSSEELMALMAVRSLDCDSVTFVARVAKQNNEV